jgi:hypothetical protein
MRKTWSSRLRGGLPQAGKRPTGGKVQDNALLADVLGLELAEVAPPVRPVAMRMPAKKAAASRVLVKTAGAPRKASAGKPAAVKSSAKAANSPAPPIARTVTAKRASVRPKIKSR